MRTESFDLRKCVQYNAKKKTKQQNPTNILAEPRIKQLIYSDQTMPLKVVIKELVGFEKTSSGMLLCSIKNTFISFHKLLSSLTICVTNDCDQIKASITIASISFPSIFPKMFSSHPTILPNISPLLDLLLIIGTRRTLLY